LGVTEDIAKKFKDGERKAFDHVYNAFSPAMYGISLRYTRCADDAQEVLQESFIKIYKHCGQYSLDRPLAAWIKTIVINTALTYIRKNYKFELHESDDYFDEQNEPVFDEEDKEMIKRQLLAFLTKLPDGYRTVFNLFVLENLTHKEISEHLGISESTSKTQYFKAKRMIQHWLKEAGHKTETA
jgi:RNA polymerase sigma-70 factor (ECF subfamily)